MTGHDTTQAPLPERAVRELAAATATLVTDHDVVGSTTALLHGCADCVGAKAAGIILAVPDSGRLEFLASTDHGSQHLELYQVQVDEGPGIDCTSTGQAITISGLTQIADRWPTLPGAFAAAGFDGVHAAPMIWQGQTLGAVNLFFGEGDRPGGETSVVAQAFADIACLVVIQTAPQTPTQVAAKTRAALDERAVIERAKGVIAYTRRIPMDAAFDHLVSLARERRQLLTTAAAAIIDQAAAAHGRR